MTVQISKNSPEFAEAVRAILAWEQAQPRDGVGNPESTIRDMEEQMQRQLPGLLEEFQARSAGFSEFVKNKPGPLGRASREYWAKTKKEGDSNIERALFQSWVTGRYVLSWRLER